MIKVKKTLKNAVLPEYATAGAACFDLVAAAIVDAQPFECTIDTGLAFEVPEGHVMLVYSRSGHGFKHGWRLANCTGVIDSDYRGSVKVKIVTDYVSFIHKLGEDYLINVGDRVAQAMIIPVNQVQFAEVDDLSDTERGVGGFGSTGQ